MSFRVRGGSLFLALVILGLVAGLTALFRLRLARDLYPPYSSLRSDPLGTRVLHDALAGLPGWTVDRYLRPLEKLPAGPARTVVLAGLDPAWGESPLKPETFNALDGLARSGSRLVLVFGAGFVESEVKKAPKTPEDEEAEAPKQQEPEPTARELERMGIHPEEALAVSLEQYWGVALKRRWLMARDDGALRGPSAPADLPPALAWESDVHLALSPGAGWNVLYTRAGEPVLAERALGRGTLVVATDAYFLSNEALQKTREAALLSWLAGPHARVQFVETHLGVEADPGVAALARRYGLAGAFGVLLLLAALFAWRRMALFVPPAPDPSVLALTYSPTAGLEALLRRALPPARLLPACLAEWRRTARPGDLPRVEAAASGKMSPVDGYNAVVKALRRR